MNETAPEKLLRGMPRDVVDILRALGELAQARKTSAFVVGGVVRDLILGIPDCDIDLDVVIEEPADAFAAAAAAALGGSVKAHTRFGTAILVLRGGRKIDLATARSETYARPGALPDVRPDAIREDLGRRDFTINSLAIRLSGDGFGELLDLFSGVNDLREGRIRVLGERSFEDDPTRILRAVRFAARFGFVLESRTEKLLLEGVRRGFLSTVSGERIMNEIALILGERAPWPPVERLAEWHVLEAVAPSWRVPPDTRAVFERLGAILDRGVAGGADPVIQPWIAYFLAAIEPVPASERGRVLERLKASRRLRELVRDLRAFEDRARDAVGGAVPPPRSGMCRALSGLGVEVLLLAMALAPGDPADRIRLYLDELRHVRPSLSGDDVEALGVAQGPRVGEILAALLDARLDGSVRSEEDERELAERLARVLDEKSKS